MKSPAHFSTEESLGEQKRPVLIVDKEGTIGKDILLKLGRETQAVFVSRNNHLPEDFRDNIVTIPFLRSFPKIPDVNYSFMFLVEDNKGNIGNAANSFIKKAENDKAMIFIISSLYDKNCAKLLKLKDKYSKIKIIFYADVFGKEPLANFKNPVNKFFYDAGVYGKLIIPGNGMGKCYPVYLEDISNGVLQVAFGSDSEGQIFYAFPKHSPTLLSVAQAIKKVKPEVKIDFSKKRTSERNLNIPSGGHFLFDDSYSFYDKFKNIFLENINPIQGFLMPESNSWKKNNYEEKNKKLPFYSFFLGVLVFVLLPLVTTLAFSLAGFKSLEISLSQLSAGNINSAKTFSSLANNLFYISEVSVDPLTIEARIFGEDKAIWVSQNVDAGKNASFAIINIINSYEKISGVLSGKSKNSASDLSSGSLELKGALESIKKLEANKNLNSVFLNKLKEKDDILNFLSSLQPVLSNIILGSGRREYLVLFQNNMELRPGGGFIGSYGILKLENGKISDFTIHDVYDADGQLKGHVEPPFAIRRYLPSIHWYLRDSNFDPDFTKSAQSCAFFLKAETGDNVDGVMAVDVSFVQNLLKAVGEIYVPEYSQKVNADNFLKLTQEHADKNSFPGSTQKKDFLSAVFRSMQNNFSSGKSVPFSSIGKEVLASAKQKHILFAFSDPSIEGIFTVNGLSSSLWDARKNGGNIVNDFLGISEANLGVNKVNYFIDRKISKNTILNDQGNISSEVSIGYDNKSNGEWPGGDYKNYLRIILPGGSALSGITIDGILQTTTDAVTDPAVYEKKGYSPPKELEVEKTEESGKTIYGVLITVPVNSKKTIAFDYTLPQKVDLSLPTTYNLRIFKQPGVDIYPFDLSFSYPLSESVVASSSDLSPESGSLVFSKELLSDRDVYVSLSKK